MQIFDTLKNMKTELEFSGKVKIYLCGVTVYDDAHIGHARTIIVFDVLRRFLESQKIPVEFVQNFTDVDDKIIDRANQEKTSPLELAAKFTKNYFDDFDGLNVKRATIYPKATEHIEDMQNLIASLVDKKYAYVTKNGVYFSVSKFTEYGKLSKKKTDDLISGARVAIDEEKNNPIDFALWKFSESEPSWDSPWGKGRPGWHIECSAMSLKYLGENFEIHGGGRDLIFPHHENEIAQSESFIPNQFAKIWMHVGMITINGEKMSKSLGNVKSVNRVLENWGPNIIRLFCLSGNYSKPIDYSEKFLKENITKLRQIESCYYELRLAEGTNEETIAEKLVKECKEEFDSALNNDLNTPLALTAFYKLIRKVNSLAAEEKITQTSAEIILPEFERMSEILGIQILKVSDTEKNEINQMIKKRDEYRMQKNYEQADNIRTEIAEKNIVFVDHKNKTTWVKQEKIKAE
ncbi:cysteine--tRNA ligase [Marine Group I thaumarchaeote]|uniref:Cysteine--tRNA ligase n=1 Tax=Marine Group I thaumarchaeote TaxID=2511932 RepID=A0A7K4MPV5_9ARCH|nr:cysteine--tRNA ligase [Marine Group I thaumarchaeote]